MSDLKILYNDMASLTSKYCGGKGCEKFEGRKYRCCEMKYCEGAKKFAKEKYGIDLTPTGHPDLLYMGENGCVVPPYLRPICSLHLCSVSYAETSNVNNDPVETEQYFQLRQKIYDEAKIQGKTPDPIY